jgi:membrane fusion protein (multidrug efflux system)
MADAQALRRDDVRDREARAPESRFPESRNPELDGAKVTALRNAPAEPAPAPPTVPTRDDIDPEPAPAAPKRRRWLRMTLFALGPAALLAGGGYMYLAGGRYVSTDNAYVRADRLTVSTDVSGIVAEVAVRENERVGKDQVLFRLDDEPYRIALESAQAQLGTVRNELATMQATYRQNLAQIEQARADVTFAEAQAQRQQDLIRRGVTTQVALEQAQHDIAAARQRLTAAQRAAEATLAGLGGSADGRIENHPRVRQAQAQVDKAERDFRHTVVRAPMAGIVARVDALQVGEYLPAAQAAFSLVAVDHVWVEANPKETDLTYLKPGDPATVTVDAYPGREWRASVESISPASGAEFSVLPAQNASGNWDKVVQRVPVRLRVEALADAPPLRSGMSADVSIDTGHQRTLAGLFGWGAAHAESARRAGH